MHLNEITKDIELRCFDVGHIRGGDNVQYLTDEQHIDFGTSVGNYIQDKAFSLKMALEVKPR